MITNSFDEAHFSVIAENIKRIKEEIAEATIKSNRSVDDVRLMAVTKTVCTEYINYAIENCGIDSSKYSGLAFGIGIERIAMLKYGINHMGKLFENDVEFLKQFKA